MTPHEDPTVAPVAIIGAGPVGLSLALGLARHGARSVLLERKATTSHRSKAPAIHLRSREILRQWGAEDALLRAGTLLETMPVYSATGRRLLSFDFTPLAAEADRPGILFLEQGRTERLLLDTLGGTGRCDVRFGAEVTGLEPGEETVTVTYLAGGERRTLRARFVVGCDGAGSLVREAIGLPFQGTLLPVRAALADVRVEDARDALPWPRNHNGRAGVTGALRLAPGHWRLIRVEPGTTDPDEEVTEEEVDTWVAEILGAGPAPVIWASRFRFQRRSSPRYRVGRVLLAGDAAHIFPPVMGQGMNTGIQDAHNLAWKLTAALDGGDTESLLDSYDEERRYAVGTISRYVGQRARLGIQAPRLARSAMVSLTRAALALPVTRRRSLRGLSMTDRGYRASALLDPADRAAGRRLPNPELRSAGGGRVRLYDVLPEGAALLRLATTGTVAADDPDLLPVVRLTPGGYEDPTGALRRLLGGFAGWILVRPDRHMAWARTERAGLTEAVRRALGQPRSGGSRVA